MRCNQVTITIDRFGKYVPKNYPSNVQRIQVYCDDFKSVYAALSKAYAMAINELAQYEDIGVRTDVYTNEFSNGDRKLHGVLPNDRTRFEEDINLEYYDDMNMQVCSDFLWTHEHSGEIINTIKKCKDEHEMKAVLKEKFGLDDYQVRKLSQIRLGMFTEEEYKFFKDESERIKAWENTGSIYYKTNKCITEIKRLETYFAAAEHYEEILKLISDTEDSDFYRIMEEKFNFSPDESSKIKCLNINDFSKKEREHKREQLDDLKKNLDIYISRINELQDDFVDSIPKYVRREIDNILKELDGSLETMSMDEFRQKFNI